MGNKKVLGKREIGRNPGRKGGEDMKTPGNMIARIGGLTQERKRLHNIENWRGWELEKVPRS